MRFVWPAQRYDGLTREAWALAAVLTAAASVVIALPLTRHDRNGDRPIFQPAESIEFVAFVQPLRQLATSSITARESTARRSRREKEAPHVDTSSVVPTPSRPATTAIDTTAAPGARAMPSTSRGIGPVAGPVGFSKVMNLSDAARDSLAKAQAEWFRKRLLSFELTPEQKDSTARAEAQRAVAARDDHRPLAIPVGSIPLRMPFGGAVKSREQQRKDSVINADNLMRFARLAERARTKRDSMMRATLAAKRDSDDRSDSLGSLTRRRP